MSTNSIYQNEFQNSRIRICCSPVKWGSIYSNTERNTQLDLTDNVRLLKTVTKLPKIELDKEPRWVLCALESLRQPSPFKQSPLCNKHIL